MFSSVCHSDFFLLAFFPSSFFISFLEELTRLVNYSQSRNNRIQIIKWNIPSGVSKKQNQNVAVFFFFCNLIVFPNSSFSSANISRNKSIPGMFIISSWFLAILFYRRFLVFFFSFLTFSSCSYNQVVKVESAYFHAFLCPIRLLADTKPCTHTVIALAEEHLLYKWITISTR